MCVWWGYEDSSDPKKFGLTLVGTVDFEHGYEYDTMAVWKTTDGRFLRGHSSGCSCSSPFDTGDVDDLTPTSPEEFQAVALEYAEQRAASWAYYAEMLPVWKMEITELFERMVKP